MMEMSCGVRQWTRNDNRRRHLTSSTGETARLLMNSVNGFEWTLMHGAAEQATLKDRYGEMLFAGSPSTLTPARSLQMMPSRRCQFTRHTRSCQME